MEEQEMPCDGRKQELAEEDEEEVDDSNDSGKSHYAYDSDDSDFELIDGTKVDPKVWDQYYKELDESEGFDITVYPGTSFNSSIVPLKSYLTDPNKKQKYTDLCGLAIGDFNSQSAKKYEFVEIVTVNASFAAGIWFYFTFHARETDDTIKIFQALVWGEIGVTPSVEFCRLKKGDGGPPQSSVDAEAAQ